MRRPNDLEPRYQPSFELVGKNSDRSPQTYRMSSERELVARFGEDFTQSWPPWPGRIMQEDGLGVSEFLCDEGLALLRERVAAYRHDGQSIALELLCREDLMVSITVFVSGLCSVIPRNINDGCY